MKAHNGKSKSTRGFFANKAPLPTPLPMCPDEMKALGWPSLDILLVSGDAYVDHPSFGAALIGRVLEHEGYRVGIIAQPRWDTLEDILRLGRPRLFAGISAGAIDSMVAHYTAFRKLRHDDAYTPGNRHGARPNRACIVYTGLVRRAFPGLPVVIGGIEASLRRAAHYDFWTDRIRRSILLDSKADLLVYGMGERAVLEIARRLAANPPERLSAAILVGVPGAAFATSSPEALHATGSIPPPEDMVQLPSYEEIFADPKALMKATLLLERQTHQGTHWAVQACGPRKVVFTPPPPPQSTEQLDALYRLPFTRRAHPSYTESIPAAGMIQFSVTAHRGCAAGCAFCSISFHQGRRIQSRSKESLMDEVIALTRHPDWKGALTDVGGPTANMWGARCGADPAACNRSDCLTPRPCRHFITDDKALVALLRALATLPGVNSLRVSSGVRHDVGAPNQEYLRELIRHYVGGQLKIAPEHLCDPVLRLMRKPSRASFEEFVDFFERETRLAKKEQYLVPYLISAFPGCADEDMRTLARWLQRRHWRPRQAQCFLPTPGTVATAMYYAGISPEGRPIYVARSDAERLRQHQILLSEKQP